MKENSLLIFFWYKFISADTSGEPMYLKTFFFIFCLNRAINRCQTIIKIFKRRTALLTGMILKAEFQFDTKRMVVCISFQGIKIGPLNLSLSVLELLRFLFEYCLN